MKFFLRLALCLAFLVPLRALSQTEVRLNGTTFTQPNHPFTEVETTKLIMHGVVPSLATNESCVGPLGVFSLSTAGCFSESEPINAKKEFGAIGNGAADDTTAINKTLQRAQATGGCAYFPHGTYLFTTPITVTNTNSFVGICIEGEDPTTTTLRYTGTVAANAAIMLAPPAAETAWFGGSMKRLTVLGNSHTLSSVEIDTSAHFRFDDMEVAGATTWGLKVYEGVHFSALHTKVDEFTADRYTGVAMPTNGIILTGNSATDYATTPSLLASPVIEGVAGTGIDIEVAGLVTVTGCQCSANGQNLKVSNDSANQVGQVTITGNLFENEVNASYMGGFSTVVTSNVFSNFTNPATGVQVDGKGVRFIGNQVGNGPVHVMSTAQSADIESNFLNSTLASGIPSYGIYDQGTGTIKTGNFFSDRDPGSYLNSERSPASNSSQLLDAQRVTTGTWTIGTPASPTYLSYAPVTAGKSWNLICYGCKLGSFFGGGGVNFPPIMEITETNNTFIDPIGGQTVTVSVNSNGILQLTHPAGDGGGEYLTGTFIFTPDNTATTSGPYSAKFQGIVQSGGNLGPSVAPTGSCPVAGTWVFSQDGHATFCNAGTWATKI